MLSKERGRNSIPSSDQLLSAKNEVGQESVWALTTDLPAPVWDVVFVLANLDELLREAVPVERRLCVASTAVPVLVSSRRG